MLTYASLKKNISDLKKTNFMQNFPKRNCNKQNKAEKIWKMFIFRRLQFWTRKFTYKCRWVGIFI